MRRNYSSSYRGNAKENVFQKGANWAVSSFPNAQISILGLGDRRRLYFSLFLVPRPPGRGSPGWPVPAGAQRSRKLRASSRRAPGLGTPRSLLSQCLPARLPGDRETGRLGSCRPERAGATATVIVTGPCSSCVSAARHRSERRLDLPGQPLAGH